MSQHNSARSDRVIRMRDGKIREETRTGSQPAPTASPPTEVPAPMPEREVVLTR